MIPNNYKVRGKHKETGRVRTVYIEAVSLSKCNIIADEKGLLEPYEITELPPREPTEPQLEFAKNLGISVPENATFYDVSSLISRSVDSDNSDPNPGLIEYADGRGMIFSKYIGKKALYNKIFNSLSGENKIAFFIFCVYRWISDDRDSNLDTHRYKDKFYVMAHELSKNAQFEKSMNKYSGQDIRFFGELRAQDGNVYTGGSINTVAYKTAAELVCKEFNLQNRKVKTLSRNNAYKENPNNAQGKGCLTLVLFIILFNIFLFFVLKF